MMQPYPQYNQQPNPAPMQVVNTPATMEQESLALSLQDAPASPRAIPQKLFTFDAQPQLVTIDSVNEALGNQIKRFANPEMFETLINNLGSDNTGVNFIKRLSVTPGGMPVFQEPTTHAGQKGATHQEIIGVIPLVKQTRRRFTTQYGTQGSDRLPDCTSIHVTRNRTGDVGFGNPGGLCAVCAHDTFIDGIGRGCRERHAVFMITENYPTPFYLDMTVYSNRPIMHMMTQLSLNSNAHYWQVVMKVTLTNTPTRTGQSVAMFNAEPIGVIDSTDQEICAGLNNLRQLCNMVLADFAKLVKSSKTQRLADINDPSVIEGVMVDASQNMPLPQGMQNPQLPNTRFGQPTQPVVAHTQQQLETQVPWVTAAPPQQTMPAPTVAAPVPQMPPPLQQPGQVIQPSNAPYNDAPPLDPTMTGFEQSPVNVQIDPNTGDYIYEGMDTNGQF